MTAAPKRVLIVHSRVGGGHISAARALASELESGGHATTALADAYVDCGRFPVTLFPSLYANLARNHPRLWSMVYYGSDHLDSDRVLGPLLRPGFRHLLARMRPDLVVSVLPAVNGLLVEAAAEVEASVEVVLTDWHAVHRFWVAPGVDHYTTPTVSAGEDCVRFGAPPARVEVVGIPVRRAFVEPRPVQPQSSFTILAMVGAEGSPRALRNIATLAQLDLDARMLVVCGRNEELRRRVQRLPARMPLQALRFVEDIAQLMGSADVLVTKAGGLTLAEAFCCRVPIVVHDVLAGQEAGNLEYVLGQGAVEYAPDPEALSQAVLRLYHDPLRRAELAERGHRLARPEAARLIARGMLARLGV